MKSLSKDKIFFCNKKAVGEIDYFCAIVKKMNFRK